VGEEDQIDGIRIVLTLDTVDFVHGSTWNDFCEPGNVGGNPSYVGYECRPELEGVIEAHVSPKSNIRQAGLTNYKLMERFKVEIVTGERDKLESTSAQEAESACKCIQAKTAKEYHVLK
jgi:hypothetical protein